MATLFLCGDVMTGRGIDQILPHPGDPRLHERWARSATRYVELAEKANGPIGAPRDFAYIWGDALDELERRAPDARIANLETAVTTCDEAWPDKAIHYRMHPRNVPCLAAARIGCCVLANNHVLDWGRPGLAETLAVLHADGIRTAGAGAEAREARSVAAIELPGAARVLVVAAAAQTSGVPREWEAQPQRSGVNLVGDLSPAAAKALARSAAASRKPGDILLASIHWGGNWGYEIAPAERIFAHALVDEGVDVVHGHSSHHAKGIEIYRGRPILYGCGDFVNDYEGIDGEEQYRGDLRLMYFVDIDARDGVANIDVVTMRARRMRLERAPAEATAWIAAMLRREGRRFDTLPSPVRVAP